MSTRLRVWGKGRTLDEAAGAAWQSLGTAMAAQAGDQMSERFDLTEIRVEIHPGTEMKVKGMFDFEKKEVG